LPKKLEGSHLDDRRNICNRIKNDRLGIQVVLAGCKIQDLINGGHYG